MAGIGMGGGMIWDVLGGLLEFGGTLFTGLSSAAENKRMSKQALKLAQQQRADILSAQGVQQQQLGQQIELGEEKLAFQKSEARRGRREREKAMKIQTANNVLKTLGTNTDLQDRVRSMWSQMGIINLDGGAI